MPSLYVHVPFCLSKCAYCGFYSHPICGRDSHSQIAAYLDGLAIEVEQRIQDAPEGVSSLFVGGGTPTALSEEDLERLIRLLGSFEFSDQGEKTVEANPGTLSRRKLALLYDWGINRLSIGVQSFSDPLLKQIGRVHTSEQAGEGIQLARESGFKNINLDLMFGLPGQTMEHWKETLEQAITYEPEHLSLYGLMIEEGTCLAHQIENSSLAFNLPDDDRQADMYEWAVEYLKPRGYERYETSNFARLGFEWQHNQKYWQGEDYIGLGPGAVSFAKDIRRKNIEDIWAYRSYLEKNPTLAFEEERLTQEDLMVERMILGLRMAQGIDLQRFEHDFGIKAQTIYGRALERYKDKGVFMIEKGFWKLNPDYAFIANQFLEEFI